MVLTISGLQKSLGAISQQSMSGAGTKILQNQLERDQSGLMEQIETASGDADNSNDSDTVSSDPSISIWSQPTGSTNPSSLSLENVLDREQTADSRAFMTFFNYPKPELGYESNVTDDDIQSVTSASDDIASLAESQPGMTNYRYAAVSYLVGMFIGNSELLGLYQKAAQNISHAKFVRNHTRLLKKLFLDLRSSGRTPSRKLAVEFLRSRRNRSYISLGIRNLIAPSDSTVREKVDIMLEQEKDIFFLLDRFLGETDSAAQATSTEDTVGQTSDDDDSSIGDEFQAEMEEEKMLSTLEATAGFLTSGRSFTLYKEGLRGFLYPTPPATTYDLNEIDYEVSFVSSFTSTFQDIYKRAIEDIAGHQLSWWPLADPESELKVGYTRVYSILPFVGFIARYQEA